MRLLDKYIGREVATHSLLGLAVFTSVLYVPELVRLMDVIVRHSGGLFTIILLVVCSLAPVFVFTVPMSVLVGVLIGLGRLSADSEIVALHACGISLRRLLRPIGFVALAAAAITSLMTFWLSPVAYREINRLETRLIASQAPYAIQPRVFDERFPHFVLYVQEVVGSAARWNGVFLAATDPPSITVAQSAQILEGPGPNELQLHLGAGRTDQYDPRHPANYDVTDFSASDLSINLSSVVASRNIGPVPAEESTSKLLRDNGPDWLEARVEFQRRLAFPFAALVFAFLGVPIGVRPRRGGRAAGLILTITLIGCYYLIYVYGYEMAKQGKLSPFLGVWVANIVAAIFGFLFLRRIETVRKPNQIAEWFELQWFRFRRRRNADARAKASAASGSGNGAAGLSVVPAGGYVVRRSTRIHNAIGFPLLVDTYLLERFFYYFFGLLAGFVLISDAFTLFDLLADISKNHISAFVVADYFRFLIPYMVYELAPLAALVATLMTLAILAKNNEVVAFKASGVSLYRLILPLALAGILVSGGMFTLSETYLPYANTRQNALRSEIKGRPPQTFSQPSQQWIFGQNSKIFNYGLYDPNLKLLGDLTILELDPKTFSLRRRVYAERATWDDVQNTWVLTGGWIRDFGGGKVSDYNTFKATSLAEFTERPSYFEQKISTADQMNWRQLGAYINKLSQAGFDTSRLRVQWYEKFSYPLIAAIVVLLGAPFAFLVGTRGAVSGLAVAVGISIFYWAASALLESMGTAGLLPALLAGWSADAMFAFLAVYFSLRMPT
ncbi:MAG TPA: LPS export ABC transporter permease LptF [Candidatus Aquilonibacter sp.]|nr:LPS export ABC transporter permease LptF [Candidatus Aquilonibacter sp.]